MKKMIVTITAMAFVATATAALASDNPVTKGPVPLPAIGLLPAMLILSTKENKNFKPVNPYAHKPSRRHRH